MIIQTYIANHLDTQNSYQRSMHFHDTNEIIYSLNDECSFFLGSQSYKINRGVLIFIPEGTIHRKFNPSDLAVDTYTIHYTTAFLRAYSTSNTDFLRIYGNTVACFQIPSEKIELTTNLFKRCLIQDDGSFGSDVQRNFRFLDLLLEFYTYFDLMDQKPSNDPKENSLVTELIKYIELHLTERIVLDELANVFFTSKYNLCRIFKKETGFTIVEYINSNRIRLACTILREENRGYDVGNRVGFSNRSNFIRTFQKLTGMTPGNYAKKYHNLTNVPIFNNFTHDCSRNQ